MRPAAAMPTARPMMPSSDRLVSNTRASPKRSCNPSVAPCTPPLRPTSSPKITTRGLVASSCSSTRRTAVMRLMRGPSVSATSVLAGKRWPSGRRPPCACNSIVPSALCSLNTWRLMPRAIRLRTPLDALQRFGNLPARFVLQSLPGLGRQERGHQLLAQPLERIARLFGAHQLCRLVGLRVLSRMARESRHREAQKRGTAPLTHIGHRLRDQPFGRARIAAVAVEHSQSTEGGEVARDVAARRLQVGFHRDPVTVVFDEEQDRQLLGRCDVERRPEAVGGGGRFTAVRDRNAPRVARTGLQHFAVIDQRLRPAHGRRVLRADTAAGRQHARPFASRQVEDDADIAAIAHAARAHHRGGQRVVEREPEREQQRTRAVVDTETVARSGEVLRQQHLAHVVAAGGELVENLASGEQLRLLERIERAGDQDLTNHRLPVERTARSGTVGRLSCGHSNLRPRQGLAAGYVGWRG